MKFQKKSKVSEEIPTSSMPDIVFMLLLFFMVTTVFRQYSGIPVELPRAKMIKKLEAKKNVVNLWANAEGEITVDDKMVEMSQLSVIMYDKVLEIGNRIVTSMKIDKNTSMSVVTGIQEELRDASALTVNYCAKPGI